MRKIKSSVILFIIMLVFFSASCVTRTNSEKHNSLSAIDSLSFDNRIDINNIKTLGWANATATVKVKYEKKGKKTTITSDNIEVIKKGSVIEKITITGEGYEFGTISSISQSGVTSSFFGGLLASKKLTANPSSLKLSRMTDPEAMAKAIANFRLIKDAQSKDAIAIMMPQYTYRVTNNDQFTSLFGKLKRRDQDFEATYTVIVTAKAVDVVADERNTILIGK